MSKISFKQRSQSAIDLPTIGATPLVLDVAESSDPANTTTLLVGASQQAFHIRTDVLTAKSPYFVNLAVFNDSTSHPVIDLSVHHHQNPNPLAGPLSYPELDGFAMALFTLWLHDEHALHGPHDFHGLNYYLCLYVLARKFEIEQLQNQVMDFVRHYYHVESMTAPPFRLEYVYANTSGRNKMREFLVATAAYRVLSKGHTEPEDTGALNEEMENLLRGGGDFAVDFTKKLVEEAKDDMEDPRKGDDCNWHEHSDGSFGTRRCASWKGFEAFESH